MSGKNYKLIYFSASGLAEPIRFLLLNAGKEFEEHLFMRDEWPSEKSKTPFGKVPILEIDGKRTHQSKAICRLLARQTNLAGDNEWEGLEIDAIVDTFDDLRLSAFGYFMEQDEKAKAAKLETLIKETIPFYFGRFEKQTQENGGYLANGKLSWADFYFACQVKSLSSKLGPEADLSKYPTIHALVEKIYSIPKIASYLAKRAPYAY